MSSLDRVDFRQLHDVLNARGGLLVGEAMGKWHPAILGEMLKAVALAKRKRYPGCHPDYDSGVAAASAAEDK